MRERTSRFGLAVAAWLAAWGRRTLPCGLAALEVFTGLSAVALAQPESKAPLAVNAPTDQGASSPNDAADLPRALDSDKAGLVYADAFLWWVYNKPRKSKVPIGYVRGGQTLRLRQPTAVSFEGCKQGWYAVEPAGYVCLDNAGSLQPTHYNQAMRALAPKPGPFPFEYGVSLGTPAYRRVPKESDDVLRRTPAIAASEVVLSELLTTTSLQPGPVPWFYARGGSVARPSEQRLVRRMVPAQTLLSLTGRFDVEQRAYYQVADGTLVPAERVQLLRRSTFLGVELEESFALPLAWPREPAPARRLTDACSAKLASEFPALSSGQLSPPIPVHERCLTSGQTRLPARVPVALSGRRVLVSGRLWLETRDGDWIEDTLLRVAEREAPKHKLAKPNDKWIHFSIQRGTLVTYEGHSAVFATLASPGSGELNARGAPRLTPTGTFRINFKHLTDDMSSEDGEHRSEWKADVPFAMYFNQPYGIHVSYWHEQFGEPKSGGCINVSPLDGARLFDWTEPTLPRGWYGVGSSAELGLGTVVVVTQ